MTSSTINIHAAAKIGEIASIIANAPNGATIIFPADKTYSVTSGLSIDVSHRDLTIDLNGSTLQQAGNTSVIWAFGNHAANQVASIDLAGADSTKVTVTNPATYQVGSYVKVFSDDALPNDHGGGEPTRLGQALKVVGITGNTLTLEGDLLYGENYATNIRVSAYNSGDLVIKNGTIRGDQSHPEWISDLVNVRSTVGADLNNLTVRDGNSMGINIIDSVNAVVSDVVVKNLRDNTSLGQLGYAVHSASSVNTTVIQLYAEAVRHATDSNAVSVTAGHVNPSKYGADIGMKTIDSIAYDTSAISYSWHTETRQSVIEHSLAFDSPGLIGARGVGNSVIDSYGVNTDRGIQIYEYGDGDGYGLVFNGVHIKDATVAAYTKVENPRDNLIINSSFEVSKFAGVIGDAAAIINTTVASYVKNFDDLMVGTAANDVLLGGKGNDIITGGAGSDYIWGGLGDDVLIGGEGRDFFAFHRITDATDVILDFQTGANHDFIDLSVLAKHYGWTADKAQYVRFVTSGADVKVQIDIDGGKNSFVELVTLKNVQPADLSLSQIRFDMTLGEEPATVVIPKPVDPVLEAPSTKAIFGTDLADKLTGSGIDDMIFGKDGSDTLTGNNGDDLLDGGAGGDKLLGGAGNDTAGYGSAKTGVTANLNDSSLNLGDAKDDVYSQIENLSGSTYDDVLSGNRGVNTIYGLEGNDRIYGLDGVDTLDGGAGNDFLYGGDKNDLLFGGDGNDWLQGDEGRDILTGGAGADAFVFTSVSDRIDTIKDFSSEEGDKLVFTSANFASIKATFSADNFVVKAGDATMTSAEPHLLYNDSTGALVYDADGSGKGAGFVIAMLENKAALHFNDFMFV